MDNKKEWKKPLVTKVESTEMHPTVATVPCDPCGGGEDPAPGFWT